MRSLVVMLAVLAVPVGLSAQTQTPPPIRTKETVVVSARDAKIINDAINELRDSRDPLVADMVADNIVKLTEAMAASGRVNEIGPLTEDEQGVIRVRELMEKYSFPGGSIFIRPRNADSSPGPRLFTFTQSSFIAMCADMASSPLVQLRAIQENKMIVVARMIADINEQQKDVISEREVLEGALEGFRNQDPQGVIIDRVEGIADALAVNADQNAPYDLVAADQQEAFEKLTRMDHDVFKLVERPRSRAVNVRYDSKIYSTTANHFVWFFIRFLLADQDALDEGIRVRRIRLGGELLDNLTAQLQIRVMQSVLDSLSEPGVNASKALVLGDFFARGPGLDSLKKAPGLSLRESARGDDFRTLVVSGKKLPELESWLQHEIAKLSSNQIG